MGNLRQKYTDEEWEALTTRKKDVALVTAFAMQFPNKEEFEFSRTNENLMDVYKKHRKEQEGVKLSQSKAPMGKILKQFPLALEAVAQRSKYGHEKYIETDHDWMNFKRVPDAIDAYDDAVVRHLAGIGEPEETELDHLKAAAWNILAKLQLTLEKQNEKPNA